MRGVTVGNVMKSRGVLSGPYVSNGFIYTSIAIDTYRPSSLVVITIVPSPFFSLIVGQFSFDRDQVTIDKSNRLLYLIFFTITCPPVKRFRGDHLMSATIVPRVRKITRFPKNGVF